MMLPAMGSGSYLLHKVIWFVRLTSEDGDIILGVNKIDQDP